MRKDPEIMCDTRGCQNTVDEDFCEDCMDKKLEASKEEGSKEGYDEGYKSGYEEAKLEFAPEVVALENLSK